MIYKSVYQSQTEDGESMTADTLHEDDPTTNTGVCKRVKEDSLDAVAALEAFVETYQIKYERATDCLTKDRDALLAFYDFPAEHWEHLRTTNPIESTFASVRHRTIRSEGCLSNKTALAMVFKLVEGAQKNWRRIDGHNQLPKLIQGVKFADGIKVIGNSAVSQAQAAA